jgi:hypothetical protein
MAMREGRKKPDSAERLRLQHEAALLHAQRMTYEQIGIEVGKLFDDGTPFNHQTMHNWVKGYYKNYKVQEIDEARTQDLNLIDIQIANLLPLCKDGNAAAHTAMQGWLKLRSRYMGLEAPQKIQHSGSVSTPFDDNVANLLDQMANVEDADVAPESILHS